MTKNTEAITTSTRHPVRRLAKPALALTFLGSVIALGAADGDTAAAAGIATDIAVVTDATTLRPLTTFGDWPW